MVEKTSDGSVPEETWDELTVSTFYTVLCHTDRAALVAALHESDESLALADGAKEIARRNTVEVDGPLSPDQIEKKRLLLHHKHLPILTDRGIIDLNENDGTVRLTEKGSELAEARERIAGVRI